MFVAEEGQRWATAQELLFLRRVGANGRFANSALMLTLSAAVGLLRRCNFSEEELAALLALREAPALTAAQLGKLPAAGAEPDDAHEAQEVAERHAQGCGGMQQAAPGSDHSLQEPQQQQLLQARLQLPGMAAIAVAVTRGAEEAAVCMRQLFNTFPDRLPSWTPFTRRSRLGEHRCDSCVRGSSELLQPVAKNWYADGQTLRC